MVKLQHVQADEAPYTAIARALAAAVTALQTVTRPLTAHPSTGVGPFLASAFGWLGTN